MGTEQPDGSVASKGGFAEWGQYPERSTVTRSQVVQAQRELQADLQVPMLIMSETPSSMSWRCPKSAWGPMIEPRWMFERITLQSMALIVSESYFHRTSWLRSGLL